MIILELMWSVSHLSLRFSNVRPIVRVVISSVTSILLFVASFYVFIVKWSLTRLHLLSTQDVLSVVLEIVVYTVSYSTLPNSPSCTYIRLSHNSVAIAPNIWVLLLSLPRRIEITILNIGVGLIWCSIPITHTVSIINIADIHLISNKLRLLLRDNLLLQDSRKLLLVMWSSQSLWRMRSHGLILLIRINSV